MHSFGRGRFFLTAENLLVIGVKGLLVYTFQDPPRKFEGRFAADQDEGKWKEEELIIEEEFITRHYFTAQQH